MMMKRFTIVSLLLITGLTACSTTKKNATTDKPVKSKPETSQIETAYFKAKGSDVPWSLSIDTAAIEFELKGQKIVFDHKDPIPAMDMNVKTYNVEYKGSTAQITIIQKECTPKDGNKPLPYTVSITLNNGKSKNPANYSGCGQYITDYRLYDIWALQEINGRKVSASDFDKQLPYLEINTTENTFGGFGGCNSIGGRIFSERKLIRFTNIISTLKACEGSIEGEFLSELPRVTSYQLKNGKLNLICDGKTNIVLKKVD